MDTIRGWLDEIVKWLKDAFQWLFDGIVDLLKEVLLALLHMVIEVFAYIVSIIPVPDFLTSYSIGGLLGQAGPVVGWLANAFDLGTAFSMIAAGYAFRLLRKLLTLGQW